MKNSEIIRQNYDKLIEAIIALEKSDPKYQVDLYLYPDGSTDEFVNVGGNSWLNDDHIKIYSCNHEYWDFDIEDIDEATLYEQAAAYIEGAIEWEEQEERYEEEWDERLK